MEEDSERNAQDNEWPVNLVQPQTIRVDSVPDFLSLEDLWDEMVDIDKEGSDARSKRDACSELEQVEEVVCRIHGSVFGGRLN